MPLSGGATDKFGNRYEGLWTVNCMLDILDEQADSIRLFSLYHLLFPVLFPLFSIN